MGREVHRQRNPGEEVMIIGWNAGYEATPTSALAKTLIDDELRRLKLAIRERMGQEHQFGPYTDEDTGRHIPGKTTVLSQGNAAAMAAVTNMQEGALYLMEDGVDLQLHAYLSGSWVTLGSVDHAILSDRNTGHPHSGLLLKDGGIMAGDLKLGSNKIVTPEAVAHTYGIFTLYRHRTTGHLTLGSVDALAANTIPSESFTISQVETEATVSIASDGLMVALEENAIHFVPQVYIRRAFSNNPSFTIGGYSGTTSAKGFGIYVVQTAPIISSASVRIRREYIS